MLGGPQACDVPGEARPGAASSPGPALTGALGPLAVSRHKNTECWVAQLDCPASARAW